MSGESINIQLGPYSNFVASHIWNLQYELSQEQSLGYNFDTVTSDKDKSDEGMKTSKSYFFSNS